jgi:hypothetical protein
MDKFSYDVAVCGGGFAGISAALAAAREGARVVLFEKSFMLGGLGTAGLITIYLPLCDGFGHQVSFGIAEELFRLSIKYGAEDRYPENWLDGVGTRGENDKRFLVKYNAQVFAILAEQLLLSEGVDVMYGSYVVDAEVFDEKIKRIFVENKSGKVGYEVKTVVDATGDCDLGRITKIPTETYKQGNVLAAWYYMTDDKGYSGRPVGVADVPLEEQDGSEDKPLISRRFTGLDGRELSEMTCLSHTQTLNNWLELRKTNPNAVISTLATTPQIRMTRKIVGEYELNINEEHKYFEDSIGMVSNWKQRGPIYEVPFRTLYSREMKNLIFAGRCTSVGETMWDVMRVIPCCAVTGQAAGTAAAMTDDFASLPVSELQAQLKKDGVILHEEDL